MGRPEIENAERASVVRSSRPDMPDSRARVRARTRESPEPDEEETPFEKHDLNEPSGAHTLLRPKRGAGTHSINSSMHSNQTEELGDVSASRAEMRLIPSEVFES